MEEEGRTDDKEISCRFLPDRTNGGKKLSLFFPLLQGGDDSVRRDVGGGIVFDDFF